MLSTQIPNISYDFDQEFGGDLVVSPSKDIAVVSGIEKSRQRVIRRLLTNPGDYIFHPNYGCGLPSFVGQPCSTDNFTRLQSLILSQMFLETSVTQSPPPKILIQAIQNGIFVMINYTINPTKQPVVIELEVF